MSKTIPNHSENHQKIMNGLRVEAAKYDDWTSDGHALYGYVHGRNNQKLFLNIIDPCDKGSYTLEVSNDNGFTTFFDDENLSPENLIDLAKRICRHPEEFESDDSDDDADE